MFEQGIRTANAMSQDTGPGPGRTPAMRIASCICRRAVPPNFYKFANHSVVGAFFLLCQRGRKKSRKVPAVGEGKL